MVHPCSPHHSRVFLPANLAYRCINPPNHGGNAQPLAIMAQQSINAPSKSLPADGMSRWKQIAPFCPFSREKFRQLVRAGKAPQPVKFSERCSAYQNRELHKFFDDPLNYCADVK